MGAEFIFMLTRDDRTVQDALALLPEALDAGVRHLGFKDIGLPLPALGAICREARSAGVVLYLEVVSQEAASEAASARAAIELGVDVLMGGSRPEIVLPILAGSGIRYYPFAGRVEGHPSRLAGSVADITASAESLLARDSVDGINLLAYRSEHEGDQLVSSICRVARGRPVVVAGSIDSAHRIREVLAAGAAAFTVGSAVFNAAFPAARSLRSQLEYVRAAAQERSGGQS